MSSRTKHKKKPKKTEVMAVSRQSLLDIQRLTGDTPEQQIRKFASNLRISVSDIKVVDTLSEMAGDEEFALVAGDRPIAGAIQEGVCAECNVKVYHTPDPPKNAKILCARCADKYMVESGARSPMELFRQNAQNITLAEMLLNSISMGHKFIN